MNTKNTLIMLVALAGSHSCLKGALKSVTTAQKMLQNFSTASTASRIASFNSIASTFAKGSASNANNAAVENALGVSITQIQKNPQWKTIIPNLNTDLTNWNASGGNTDANATALVNDVTALGNTTLFSNIFPDGLTAYQNALTQLMGSRGTTSGGTSTGGVTPPSATSTGIAGTDIQNIFNESGANLTTVATALPLSAPIQNLATLGTDAQPAAASASLLPIAEAFGQALTAEFLNTLDIMMGQQAPVGQIASLVGFNYTPNSSLSSMVYQVINSLQQQAAGTGTGTGNVTDLRSIFAGGTVTMNQVQPFLTGSPDVSLLSVQATGAYAATLNQAVGIVTAMKQALVNGQQGGTTTSATGTLSTGVINALNALGSINQGLGLAGFSGFTATTPLATLSTQINTALTLLNGTLTTLNTVVVALNQNQLTQIPSINQQFSSGAAALTQIQNALGALGNYAKQTITSTTDVENDLSWYNMVCETFTALPLVQPTDASVSSAATQTSERALVDQLIALVTKGQSIITSARTAGILSAQSPANTIQFTVSINGTSYNQSQLTATNNGNSITYGSQTVQATDTVVITSITLGAPITA